MNKSSLLIIEKSDEIYDTLDQNILVKSYDDNEILLFGADSLESACMQLENYKQISLILLNIETKLFDFQYEKEKVFSIETFSTVINEISKYINNYTRIILYTDNKDIKTINIENDQNLFVNKKEEDGSLKVLNYREFNFSDDLNNLVKESINFKLHNINLNKSLTYIKTINNIDCYQIKEKMNILLDDNTISSEPPVYIYVKEDGIIKYSTRKPEEFF